MLGVRVSHLFQEMLHFYPSKSALQISNIHMLSICKIYYPLPTFLKVLNHSSINPKFKLLTAYHQLEMSQIWSSKSKSGTSEPGYSLSRRKFLQTYETIPKKRKCKKTKWLSEEALQIAEKRRKVKSKGEKKRYTHLNAEFQRIAKRDKKVFLGDQWKEREENNRMGKTRDLFKKIRDTKWAQ